MNAAGGKSKNAAMLQPRKYHEPVKTPKSSTPLPTLAFGRRTTPITGVGTFGGNKATANMGHTTGHGGAAVGGGGGGGGGGVGGSYGGGSNMNRTRSYTILPKYKNNKTTTGLQQSNGNGAAGGRNTAGGISGFATRAGQTRLEQPTIASALRTAGNRLIEAKKRAMQDLKQPDKLGRFTTNRADKWVKPIASKTDKMPKIDKWIKPDKHIKAEKTVERKRSTFLNTGVSANKSHMTNPKLATRSRLLQSKRSTKDLKALKREKSQHDQSLIAIVEPVEDAKNLQEFGIQTNEAEILNHELLIGDIKLMLPSKELVEKLENERKEAKTKELLSTQRKFEPHDEQEAEHLTDLKEFMEQNYVSKRQRKPRNISDYDQNTYSLMKSMDEFFNHDVPKSESITDIKGRIKRKEQELLRLFDSVDVAGKPPKK